MKEIAKEYINKYLELSSKYAKIFPPIPINDRLNQKTIDGYKSSPHGGGIWIQDFKNNIEIDFDYFGWNKQKEIKYFNLWKINQFIKSEGKIDEISKEIWDELINDGYIRKYFNSQYYYLTGKE